MVAGSWLLVAGTPLARLGSGAPDGGIEIGIEVGEHLRRFPVFP